MKKSLNQPLKQQVQNQMDQVLLDDGQFAALQKLMENRDQQGTKESRHPWVPLAAELLHDATPLVCTVIGFPLGATLAAAKAQETPAEEDADAPADAQDEEDA